MLRDFCCCTIVERILYHGSVYYGFMNTTSHQYNVLPACASHRLLKIVRYKFHRLIKNQNLTFKKKKLFLLIYNLKKQSKRYSKWHSEFVSINNEDQIFFLKLWERLMNLSGKINCSYEGSYIQTRCKRIFDLLWIYLFFLP